MGCQVSRQARVAPEECPEDGRWEEALRKLRRGEWTASPLLHMRPYLPPTPRERTELWRYVARAELGQIMAKRGEDSLDADKMFQSVVAKARNDDSDGPDSHSRVILNDVPRTEAAFANFGALGLLPSESTHDVALENVLRAFAIEMPEVGYAQGMSLVASMILRVLHFEEAEAWALLLMVARKIQFAELWKPGLPGLHLLFERTSKSLQLALPAVHSAILGDGSTPISAVCTGWFMTGFLSPPGKWPAASVMRLWDIMVLEQPDVIASDILVNLAVRTIKAHATQLKSAKARGKSSFDMLLILKEPLPEINFLH